LAARSQIETLERPLDVADIVVAGLLAEIAHGHVFDHALAATRMMGAHTSIEVVQNTGGRVDAAGGGSAALLQLGWDFRDWPRCGYGGDGL
jgi:hypothetical protein